MARQHVLTTVLLWLTVTAPATGQIRSVEDLKGLGTDSLPGHVAVYYTGEVARAEAAEVQHLMEACIARYRDTIADIPTVAVAILDSTSWIRVSRAPYGFPHHVANVTRAVIVVPARPAAIFSDIGIDSAAAPQFFRLLALHELGHLLNWQAVGLDPGSIGMSTPWPLPGWYREFAAAYFRFSCLTPDAPAVPSREWLAANRPLYPLLDEAQRMHERQSPDGTPYIETPEYWKNVAWVMQVVAEAARRHYARLGQDFLPLLRDQWNSSSPMTTDAIINEMTQSDPDLVRWLKQMGAIR